MFMRVNSKCPTKCAPPLARRKSFAVGNANDINDFTFQSEMRQTVRKGGSPISRHRVGGLVRKSLALFAKAAAAVAVIAVAVVGLLLLVMWREHKTSITLPPPTGHFAVGRTTFAWSNDAETDDLAPVPGSKRQVMAWVWYPAARSPHGTPVLPYRASW